LSRHVETDVTEGEMASLLAWAGDVDRVHVILSANVFVGAVRALALAAASAPVVTVKPSRREPITAELLVRALTPAPSGWQVSLASDDEIPNADEVHVYGRDETIAEIAPRLRAGARLRSHGTGLGVAVVGAGSDLDEAAESLSW